MSNTYYNAPATPVDFTKARAEGVRSQFDAIEAAFDKLPSVPDLVENRLGYVVAGGTANVLTATLSPAATSYVDGMTLKVLIATTNSAAATMNVDGLGPIPIYGRDGTTVDAGDLIAGSVETMIYVGGHFIIREVAGAQGPQGLQGPPGETSGVVGPTGATGAPGATGATGATGPAGADGADGLTILNGAGAPTGGDGVDGDFYIRTSNWTIYGPKTAGAWGAATSIVGPVGATGATGAPGASGAWGSLTGVPAIVSALAAMAGVDDSVIQFTGANTVAVRTLSSVITNLSAGELTNVINALGVISVHSKSLTNPGYIRFNLGGEFFILQWGSQNFSANATTVVNYPCPDAYTVFSIAVVSSTKTGDPSVTTNLAGVASCGLTSFSAYSPADSAYPGFWIAVGK